ncbi:MAG: LLM class flavin-dependent oxidoreductase [Ktedonobacteraceae bacterium]|nr:LLM class flavin-dependent oxidoreductase [Ktedonobacteraceae bacterium]
MVAAISRRRPWKLARETMTLDHLSRGRIVLPVGLGAAADDAGFYKAYIEANRQLSTSFDITWEGETPGNDPERASAIVRPRLDAGITWWIEARWNAASLEEVRERIRDRDHHVLYDAA